MMKERYALLIEVDGTTYEAIDLAIDAHVMAKIQGKLIRREPFAVHYCDDTELFERELQKEKARKS